VAINAEVAEVIIAVKAVVEDTVRGQVAATAVVKAAEVGVHRAARTVRSTTISAIGKQLS